MSKNFFRHGFKPKDVAPEDANRILDRLNALNSAEEIAGSVANHTGQRVLSMRVAKRIFKNRVALGKFQDLRQVAAVPGVGIKKFTAIVAAFSNSDSDHESGLEKAEPEEWAKIPLRHKSLRPEYYQSNG